MDASKLVPDLEWMDDHEAGAIALFGFVGKSVQAGRWRLYTRLDLTDYVEFTATDVLHAVPVSKDFSPVGGSVLWLKPEARLRCVSSRSLEQQSSFLRGPVTSGFLPTARRVKTGGGYVTETVVETIVSFLAGCPTHRMDCTQQCTVTLFYPGPGICPLATVMECR